MAIYTIPIGIDRINVSRQGSTFTKNASGFIIRKRRKPLLKRSAKATQQRVNFRHVVSNYRLMSPGLKAAWKSKTPQFTRVNSLGNTYELLGNQLYQGLNQNRVQQDLVINEVAVDAVVFPVRSIISSTFDIDPVDLSLILNVNSVPIDFTFNFFANFVNNAPGALTFSNDYNFIQSFPTGTYSQYNLSTQYQLVFGSGPPAPIGPPLEYFIQIVLQATYLPSGEKQVLDSYTATEVL